MNTAETKKDAVELTKDWLYSIIDALDKEPYVLIDLPKKQGVFFANKNFSQISIKLHDGINLEFGLFSKES